MSNIIVGSGVAGMSLALLLAKQGEKVLLIEAKEQIAPLLNGFHRKGLFFDTGFHYAGGMLSNNSSEGLLYRWLNVLNVWKYIDEKDLRFVTEEFNFKKGKYFLPPTSDSLLHSIKEQFSENKEEDFIHFLRLIQEVLD